MIRVYDSNEKLFNHNGIKILHPLVADVTKKDNSDYFIELKDSIENLNYYQKGMIIRASTPWGIQGFRCTNPKVRNNKVECTAWHLSYDAKNYIIKDANAVDKNCNGALDHFNASTDIQSPFKTVSDISSILSTRVVRKSLFEVYEWLISEDKYGGHWDRDNWTLGIKSTIGQDRGVVLASNKNIKDIEVSENWDNVCTKLLPYTTDGEVAINLDEVYIELENNLYDIPYTKVVKFENKLSKEDYPTEEEFIAATKSWLKGVGLDYIEQNKFPLINYSVSANIDNISDVGDVIAVKHQKCNVDIMTSVISIKYDVIKGKYKSIEFGNYKKELKSLKEEIASEVTNNTEITINNNMTLLGSELKEATAKIHSVLSDSHVIYDGKEILIVDKLPKEEATYCIKINSAGIGFSSTGIYGTFNSAWTIDGTLDMQKINVIGLTCDLLKSGTLILGGNNNSNGQLEVYDEAHTLIAEMNKNGLKYYGKDNSYVLLNNEVGFAGFDKNDNQIYWVDEDEFHMKKSVVEEEITLCNKLRFIPIEIFNDKGNLVNDGIGLVSTVS